MDSKLWDVICFAEEFWMEHKFFPSLEDFVNGTKLKRNEIALIITEEKFKKNMEVRGIDTNQTGSTSDTKYRSQRSGQSGRLSDAQLAVIALVTNPYDRRSHTEKLKELGVSPQTYNGWKKNKRFAQYLKDRSKELLGDSIPEVREVIARRAAMGDFKFTKYFMELTGEYNPSQGQNAGDIKVVILRLIEVIQRHVKDPAILQAIARDFQEITSPENGASHQTRQLNSVNSAGLVNGEVL